MRTAAVEDYVKTIYKLQTQTDTVSTSALAERTGTSAAAVTKMLKHLAEANLVAYTPYHGVRLTSMGEKIALEVIRHHRLLELYLAQAMGYSWDQVDAEAEKLEHVISEEFEARIDALLGFPAFDPHGDPIPTPGGVMPRVVLETLGAQEKNTPLIVRRVADGDAALLRHLGERGLHPGAAVQILDREPFGGSLRLDVDGQEESLSPKAADSIFVERSAVREECSSVREGDSATD